MIAHVTYLEISEISIYLPSILVFVFNLIAVSFAFVLDTLFSFFFTYNFFIRQLYQPRNQRQGKQSKLVWISGAAKPASSLFRGRLRRLT